MSSSEDTAAAQQSPLHQCHVAAGAKFAAFSGWSMPLEYADGGVLAEHAAVREGVAVFDVSHLGKATVAGPGARTYVNSVLTNDLSKINIGQAQYTMLCTPEGGVVDDLIAYLKSDDEVFLIPNAANTAAVVEVLAAEAPNGVTVTDEHHDHVVIAVQGPKSDEVLTARGLPTDHEYMSFTTAEIAGAAVTVCRTGYTGERGYEIVAPTAAGVAVWEAVLAAGESYGIRPAGLGARDTLRTEMGYALHGNEISPERSPVQARLGWAIGWKKESFRGHEALRAEKAEGPARTLRGLRATGRGIPRAGMVVVDAEGAEIGIVTSGTFSPTLRTGIALALVDRDVTEGPLLVQVRRRTEEFDLTKPPFVTPGVRDQ
ncbi:glycine cleavage system aminomethyltransferase GcvT [Propionibacteriaceae bacterium Y1685]|uniref:glycine cleavage system aminomethyltransferase GcvT n=1 Tax=Microlunatus sp. Y1700 TaxID=3418487 RepID=UPI003B75E83C